MFLIIRRLTSQLRKIVMVILCIQPLTHLLIIDYRKSRGVLTRLHLITSVGLLPKPWASFLTEHDPNVGPISMTPPPVQFLVKATYVLLRLPSWTCCPMSIILLFPMLLQIPLRLQLLFPSQLSISQPMNYCNLPILRNLDYQEYK